MMTDTPSHFAWSESGVGKPIGGSPGGGSPNGEELERAKSADNTKLHGRVHQLRTNISRVPLVRFRPNFQRP